MTRITASYDWQAGQCSLEVLDHAAGSVQVCAAISALVYALAGYIKNAEHSAAVLVQENTVEKANARFRFMAGDEGCGAFLAVAIGLMQIAKQYPAYASMEFLENKGMDPT